MSDALIALAVTLFLSALVPLGALVTARLLMPKAPTAIKQKSYESGVEPVGSAWIQFNVRYYLYALIFLIFDIAIVYLMPWAVAFGDLDWSAFAAMTVFIGVLTIGLLHAWQRGALDWVRR